MIAAILLAAGESKRMGAFKQLLPIAGKTFIEQCADTLLASRVDEVIVVTGHRGAEVQGQLRNRPVKFAHNADYRKGMSGSIQCGLAAVSASAQAVLLALGDQPLVQPDTINRLLAVYRQTRACIVAPVYRGKRGHPIILDMGLREEILQLDADQGLKQVVHAHLAQIQHVMVDSEAVLVDFDLPEEYARLSQS